MPKIKKIATKMLLVILPVVLIAMAVLTFVSAESSSKIIEEQIQARMDAELNDRIADINGYLDVVRKTAMNISNVVGASYQATSMDTYEAALTSIINDNDLVLGSGLWFEPYTFDKNQKYFGPYIYKDGNQTLTSYDYSNEEYDYFNQEYYKLAKNGATDAIITDPYYDETLDTIMATCTAPIYNTDKKFIGAVTVDLELSTIQNLVDEIKIGEDGKAELLASDGTYLHAEDADKVSSSMKMQEDTNTEIAKAGKSVLDNEKGTLTVKDGSTRRYYYDTIDGVDWKLIIDIPQSEIEHPVKQLFEKLVIVCIIAIILCSLVILYMISTISKEINSVKRFALALSEGDFSIDSLKIKTEDELGQMSHSLNTMYQSNKGVIKNIADHAQNINHSSETLNSAADDLLTQFSNIEKYMEQVNEEMMSSGAATEEVNASVEEVNSSVNILTSETDLSSNKANEIRQRALTIEQSSRSAHENATGLAGTYEEQMKKAVESAKVVENIGEMAGVISEIAEQINLLSLNASIEAARAGEQGRGFAVVATEIGNLAGETADAVSKIQNIIQEVQSAFAVMSDGANSLLGFVKDTVTPDYNNFVDVAKQYGKDAEEIEQISTKIAEMTDNIEKIMGEVSDAIQNIAESAQNTASNSNEIMNSVETVSGIVENVSSMSKSQEKIAGELNVVVDQFKL